MAILVQSFLNSATRLSTTATTATTVAQLKTLVNAIEGVSTSIMEFYIVNPSTTSTALVSGTLGSYGITTATTIYSSNTISTATSKVDRQLAKLELAQLRRQAGGDTSATFYRSRNIYDVDLLADKYTSNTSTVGTTSTLVIGRPWVSIPSPVTQDLILFFDSERSDCYPGTGTTIYNLVDNTPSTLGGNCTFSNGVLRLNNNTGNMGTNNARINCQTVTNFRTISLWYRQVSDSSGDTRYILDARESVVGGYIYTGDPYGPAWAGSTMYEDGGVGVQVNYTEQIGTWRNLTLVNTAPMTDDINLFSRYSNDEGLDVEFGAVMIYSRAITYEENLQNFNQFKTRYGL